MATRKANWVGNAILHIGPGLDKRKSFPRNSHGFEPLEMYFKRGKEEEEENESSSDELERQVREKILQKRRLAEAEKKKASLSPAQPPSEHPSYPHLPNGSPLSPTASSPGLPPRAVPTRLSFSLSPPSSPPTSPIKESPQSLEMNPGSGTRIKESRTRGHSKLSTSHPSEESRERGHSELSTTHPSEESRGRGHSKLSTAHPSEESRGRGHSKLSTFQLSCIDDSDSDDNLQSLLGASGPASQLVSLSQCHGPLRQTPPRPKNKDQSSWATKKASTMEPDQTQQRYLSPSRQPTRVYSVSPMKSTVTLQRGGSTPTSGPTQVATWSKRESVYAFTSDSEAEEPDIQHKASSVMKGTFSVRPRQPSPDSVQWFVPDDIARTHRAVSAASETTQSTRAGGRRASRQRTGSSAHDREGSLTTGAKSQTSAEDTPVKKPRRRRTQRVVVPLKRLRKRAHQKDEEEEEEKEEEEKEEEEKGEEEEKEEEKESGSDSESCAPGVDVVLSGGGRRYRRLAVTPRKSHTPGVRRSKRTRIAPVEFWNNEAPEYDTKRLSGVLLRGVRVPIDPPEQRRKLRRRKREEEEEEPAYENPALRIRVDESTVEEREVIFSKATAQPVDQEDLATNDHKCLPMYRSRGTANGIMTFAPLGEKTCSRTEGYQLFYYVLRGKLLVKIANQEFHLQPQMEVMIPSGMFYSIRNKTHLTAEVFFYTHRVNH